MKIQEIFELATQVGIDHDPRGRKKIEKILAKIASDYKEMSKKKKEDFDIEKLTNPYSDSGIHYSDEKREVKRVLVGIDITSAEVLLAKELERQGKKIDLIIAHHPEGKALTNIHEVMDIQIEVLEQAGVPANVSEKILEDRLRQVFQALAPINHYQAIDTAKILDIQMMNIHTPADNCVWKFVDEFISKKKPENVGEIVEVLKDCLLYTSPSPRDGLLSRMPSSA